MVPEERSDRGGISNRLDKIESALKLKEDPNKKLKVFKRIFPFSINIGSWGKIRKGKVLVLKITNNNRIIPRWQGVEDGMIYLNENGTYHDANANHVLYLGKYPTIIVPEWSITPFSPSEHFKETVKEGAIAPPQKVIINAAKLSTLKTGIGLKGKGWFIIIIVVAAAIWILNEMLTKK